MNRKKDQGKRMSKTIKKTKSTKEQDDKNLEPPLWSQIPATVLFSIYTNLGDVDRISMARVCKPWYQVFHEPALWRSRRFVFGRKRTKRKIKEDALYKSETAFQKSDGKYAIEFSKQFPTSLQDIEVSIFRTLGFKEIANDFKEFSACLDGAKLKNICIFYVGRPMVQPNMRIDLMDSLKRLIHNQHCLRKFRIEWTRFDLESGLQFLQCLADASAATVQNLSLYHFFEMGMSIFRDGRVFKELQKFRGLSCIELDYDAMSEELAKTWLAGCPHLSFIKLCADEYVHPTHVIACETWKSLVNTHPNLLIELRASIIQDTKQTLGILSPAIPLFEFNCYTYREVTTEYELTRLLDRVANYHRTIKHLYLGFRGRFPNLDTTAVQNILSKCTHLLLNRVAHYHRTIKHLYLRLSGHFPNVDSAAVQDILSKCTSLLRFKCKLFNHSFTNTWILSQSTLWLEENNI